jgi:hypothetical protein
MIPSFLYLFSKITIRISIDSLELSETRGDHKPALFVFIISETGSLEKVKGLMHPAWIVR